MAINLAPDTARLHQPIPPAPVEAVVISLKTVTPELRGYGQVVPVDRWEGVAQLAGEVIWKHPNLKEGATFPAGTQLLKIDPKDYKNAITRATAALTAAEASLAEHLSRAESLRQSLAIGSSSLGIAESEFKRNQGLAASGHISNTQLENIQRNMLAQRQSVQNLQTQVTVLPSQQAAIVAKLADARATLAHAEDNLSRTTMAIPIHGRITHLNTDVGQFVPMGFSTLTAEGIDNLEVKLELPFDQLLAHFPAHMNSPESMPLEGQQLATRLRYDTIFGSQEWQGTVQRIDSGLIAASRSARLYIAINPSSAPLPALNLYVEAMVTGPPLLEQIVVPRQAIHNGRVFIADHQNKLQFREVHVAFHMEDLSVIDSGLKPGELLILTDLTYPVAGMPVEVTLMEPGESGAVSK